ncbi:MAG: SGNH/GDSL hydrolase family protein [Alistipes sp.]|nr:SGNH/GDSL hydrolase family protein [Alistipes sp.]
MAVSVSAQKFVDASTLNVCGQTLKSESNPFSRFDPTKYPLPNKHTVQMSTYSTGMYIMFSTDSKNITAKWKWVKRGLGNNMTPILQRGLDLYIEKDGKWFFVGVGRPSGNQEKCESTWKLAKNMPEGTKKCMLYLPVWSEVTELQLGIDENSSIAPIESPYRYKVLTHGSSITHGASASRPGMTYAARMSRYLGFEFTNFGFSGECKLQPEFAKIIAETEADAYMFDAFSNPSAKEIRERLEPFIKTITEAHPDKPFIFLQTHMREDTLFDEKWLSFNLDRRATVRELMPQMAKKYKNVYFLDAENVTSDDYDGTIDGAHPSDLGFTQFINKYQKRVQKILKKYGIK